MPDPIVPDDTDSDPVAPVEPSDSAPAPKPASTVQLTEAEYARMQGENRVLRRRAEKAEKLETDRKAKDDDAAAEAAGEFQKGIANAKARADAAEDRLRQRDVRDSVRDYIATIGLTSTKAAALLRLVDIGHVDEDASQESIEASVAVVLQQYPDLFVVEADPNNGTPETPRMRRTPGPSAPPDAQKDSLPANYLSPEEYVATPQPVRLTESFRSRIADSRPFWPKTLPATTFAIGE